MTAIKSAETAALPTARVCAKPDGSGPNMKDKPKPKTSGSEPTAEPVRSEDPDRTAILQRRAALVAATIASMGIACTPAEKANVDPNLPPQSSTSVEPIPQPCLSPRYVPPEPSDAGAAMQDASMPDLADAAANARPKACLSVRRPK
jgi:hypothetical protein